ncbi:hypothetical protein FRC19_007737 [Serendipita sp. 401]|nr:hypothetical protein FRC19_007737 [Serendipita sp. 401]KAG8866913.1 hypothetical protein FRC20_007193 [Serendipita sp. 405]KAG9054347.1 hypothetical protein FS842_005396 [Serendipita sp. 407]
MTLTSTYTALVLLSHISSVLAQTSEVGVLGQPQSSTVSNSHDTPELTILTWASLANETEITSTQHEPDTPNHQPSSLPPPPDSSTSSNSVARIVAPIVAVVLIILFILAGLMLVRWRRHRALRAHRRRSSWMASQKYRWPTDAKLPVDDVQSPSDNLQIPPEAKIHQHRNSFT